MRWEQGTSPSSSLWTLFLASNIAAQRAHRAFQINIYLKFNSLDAQNWFRFAIALFQFRWKWVECAAYTENVKRVGGGGECRSQPLENFRMRNWKSKHNTPPEKPFFFLKRYESIVQRHGPSQNHRNLPWSERCSRTPYIHIFLLLRVYTIISVTLDD